MRIKQRSLRGQLIWVIMLVTSLVLLLASAAFFSFETLAVHRVFAERMTTLAQVVAANLGEDLAAGDRAAAAKTLSTLSPESQIRAAGLYGMDGSLLVKYQPQSNPWTVASELSQVNPAPGPHQVVIIEPVMREGVKLGSLYLISDHRLLSRQMKFLMWMVAPVILFTLALALGFSALIQQRISKPILTVVDAARQVAVKGDYAVRVPTTTVVELDGLIQNFNSMVEQIHNRSTALRKSEETYRNIVETANEGIWILDSQGRIVFINDQMLGLLGVSRDEALGRAKQDFAFDEDQEFLTKLWAGRQQGVSEHVDVRFRRKDGRELWTSMSARPLFGPGRQFMGALDMFADVTERKKAEQELQLAHEQIHRHAGELAGIVQERTARLRETIAELEAFSYSLSHDMRAPLRAMRSFAEMFSEQYGGQLDATGQDWLRRIIAAAGRLDQLILDVLKYNRFASDAITLHPISLEKVIEQLIAENPAFQAPHAEIQIQRPLLPVMGHDASVTQCLSNLLSNAVKFTEPTKKVVIRIRTEDMPTAVRVWIEDNGIGIAPGAQARLFGLFQRLHRGYEGTGIGLSIVRKAAERMGGQVGVESEVGVGSRFWLQLPKPL